MSAPNYDQALPNVTGAVKLAGMASTPITELRCDMTEDCDEPIAMIDDKGFIYCAEHGAARRSWRPCRKLRPHELNRLRRGETVERY